MATFTDMVKILRFFVFYNFAFWFTQTIIQHFAPLGNRFDQIFSIFVIPSAKWGIFL
jgi:hypothetical protein